MSTIFLWLWVSLALALTHVTIEHAFGRAAYIQEGQQFLAEKFGRGPRDEYLVARSWLTTLIWMCIGCAFAWHVALSYIAFALA